MRRTPRALVLFASFVVLATTVLSGLARAATPVGPFTVDLTSRESVRQFWFAVHEASEGIAPNWTGNIAGCVPGTVSPDFLDATLTRINYFRAMAGVPSDVTFTAENNAKAQATALIMSAQRSLSHRPPGPDPSNPPGQDPGPPWRCWTQLGYDGAGVSNLAGGNTGPTAIDQLVEDGGEVGHRRTMLNPQILSMGSGSVPATADGFAAEAQLMVDNPSPEQRPARDAFVAWPPKGFVPSKVVFPRWSFVLRGGDFTNATVTMQRPDGSAVPAAIQTRTDFAGPGIVWLANNLVDGQKWPQPANDEPITVTVGNVVVGGVASTFTYTVTVFDAAVADPTRTVPVVSGPDAPPLNQASAYTVNAIPNAIGFQWRTSKLTPLDLADGAETGLGNFDAVIGPYNPISTTFAATGPSSFRLTTGQAAAARQTLTLKRTLVPNANGQLTFKTRAEQLANVTAVAEVSADNGVSWTPVYTEQATGDTTFNARTVPLGPFAGRHLLLRFRVENSGTGNTGCCGIEGWYFDDVTLNNVLAADAPAVSEVAAPTTSFSFTPTEPALFDVSVRPRFFGPDLFGAWSAPKQVSTLPPAVAPAITGQPQSLTVADGAAAAFTVTASGTPPLTFTWSRNGTDLVDGPGVAGSRTATLSLTGVHAAQAGTYRVQVGNAVALVASNDAVLTVTPPPNTLTAALDSPALQWTTAGNTPWASQAGVTHDGVDAAQSGRITDNQTSTLETTVTGPATVSFWWKVESEATFDFLKVTVDGAEQFAPGISGNIDWQQRTITLAAGPHTIRWSYSKDGSVSTGQDAGWVDQITITPVTAQPPAAVGLTAALDEATLQWATAGNTPWASQAGVTHDGVDAAQSGRITDNQTSTLETTVTGPATVSFWWKVESEATFDFLKVTVDGAEQFAPGISGNIDWQQRTITLAAGPHTIRWSYSKDGSVSTGQDAGWVDQITITPVTAQPPAAVGLTAALDEATLQWATAGNTPWASQAGVTHDGVDAAQSGRITDNQTSTLETTVTGPATVSFWWKVESEATFDFLKVTVDGAEQFAPGISGNIDWQQRTITLAAGPHTIRWSYSKDGSVSTGQDAGWVDQITITR